MYVLSFMFKYGMHSEVYNLEDVCKQLINAVEAFPKDKVDDILFDQWSLKNSISHIIGWNLLRIKEINAFLNNEPIIKINNFQELNEVFVDERKDKSWDEVFKEFESSCHKLVISFKSIPEDLMDKKVWEDSSMTPGKWLDIDTKHLRGEHLAQLNDYMNIS